MKLKKGFELRDVCGEKVIVAQGLEHIDFSKIVSLNESAALLWEKLQGKEFDASTAAALLIEEYDVDSATAQADASRLLDHWKKIGVVEE
ncbi:MAG TPA: PqqD family protein [Candidatus Caccomonas pullistercoris]|nr:PqqD family protein [Candidatus Caccomonas pullistercoris]